MTIGASTNMNILTVDGDWMGRAYPVAWQTTPVVFQKEPVFCLQPLPMKMAMSW